MKLYHGSKNGDLKTIKKNQAKAGEGLEVPADELLEAIYLTPSYEFALACAARPYGVTNIDSTSKKIEFENPKLFNPDETIYVYEVEVPAGEARAIDELQYVVENKNELEITNVSKHRAGDIEQYYELLNFKKEEKEHPGPEFKIR